MHAARRAEAHQRHQRRRQLGLLPDCHDDHPRRGAKRHALHPRRGRLLKRGARRQRDQQHLQRGHHGQPGAVRSAGDQRHGSLHRLHQPGGLDVHGAGHDQEHLDQRLHQHLLYPVLLLRHRGHPHRQLHLPGAELPHPGVRAQPVADHHQQQPDGAHQRRVRHRLCQGLGGLQQPRGGVQREQQHPGRGDQRDHPLGSLRGLLQLPPHRGHRRGGLAVHRAGVDLQRQLHQPADQGLRGLLLLLSDQDRARLRPAGQADDQDRSQRRGAHRLLHHPHAQDPHRRPERYALRPDLRRRHRQGDREQGDQQQPLRLDLGQPGALGPDPDQDLGALHRRDHQGGVHLHRAEHGQERRRQRLRHQLLPVLLLLPKLQRVGLHLPRQQLHHRQLRGRAALHLHQRQPLGAHRGGVRHRLHPRLRGRDQEGGGVQREQQQLVHGDQGRHQARPLRGRLLIPLQGQHPGPRLHLHRPLPGVQQVRHQQGDQGLRSGVLLLPHVERDRHQLHVADLADGDQRHQLRRLRRLHHLAHADAADHGQDRHALHPHLRRLKERGG